MDASGEQVLAIWGQLEAVASCWELQILDELDPPPETCTLVSSIWVTAATSSPGTSAANLPYLYSSSLRRLFFFFSDTHCGSVLLLVTLYTCEQTGTQRM